MAWLVVGFGCDLAGDDGFGISVANMVAELAKDTPKQISIEVMAKRILAPEFVENIRSADGVIFADASATLPLGIVQCTDLQALRQAELEQECCATTSTGGAQMSHQCNPLTLLHLCNTLYLSSPPAWLYAVGASNFGLSENLSSMVADLVPKVAAQIIDKIERESARSRSSSSLKH